MNFFFKNYSPLPAILLILGLNNPISAQCYCDNVELIPSNDQYPAIYKPQYDSEDRIYEGSLWLKFNCIADVIDIGPDEYCYIVLYREAGTTDWIWAEPIDNCVSDDYSDFNLDVWHLKPGVQYEFRVTCPPLSLWDDSYVKYMNFLNGDPVNNVTNVWQEDPYCPNGAWIENLEVAEMNFSAGTAKFTWEYNVIPPTNVQLYYKVAGQQDWIYLTDYAPTDIPQYTLGGLSACTNYDFKVATTNACGVKKDQINFKLSDCSARITGVSEVLGTSAIVHWASTGELAPTSYTVGPFFGAEWYTGPALEYNKTELLTDHSYSIRVIPSCSGAQCINDSELFTFRTQCDPFEYNNTFATAASISVNQQQIANLSPRTEEDFFRFTAPCERIRIKNDHPLVQTLPNDFLEDFTDLPVQVFDENFNQIYYSSYIPYPQFPLYESPFYSLIPGNNYYLKIKAGNNWTIEHERLCYSFSVESCNECYNNAYNMIYALDNINSLPATDYAAIEPPFNYTPIQWQISSGQAEIVPTDNPSEVIVLYEHPGTVVISATLTRCDGATMIYYKTVQVSDPCYIPGTYSHPGFPQPFPLESDNTILNPNYTISLSLPAGVQYQWTLVSGQATFFQSGTKITIQQSSLTAVFQLTYKTGDCAGQSRLYTFTMPVSPPPAREFILSPNPASEILEIRPATDVTESLKASENSTCLLQIFNKFSVPVKSLSFDPGVPARISCADLTPGSYTVRIIKDGRVYQYPFTKI